MPKAFIYTVTLTVVVEADSRSDAQDEVAHFTTDLMDTFPEVCMVDTAPRKENTRGEAMRLLDESLARHEANDKLMRQWNKLASSRITGPAN